MANLMLWVCIFTTKVKYFNLCDKLKAEIPNAQTNLKTIRKSSILIKNWTKKK